MDPQSFALLRQLFPQLGTPFPALKPLIYKGTEAAVFLSSNLPCPKQQQLSRESMHIPVHPQTGRHICGPRRAPCCNLCRLCRRLHETRKAYCNTQKASRQPAKPAGSGCAPRPLKTPKKEQALTKPHAPRSAEHRHTPRSRGILTVPLKEKGTDRLVTDQGHTAGR